MMKTLVATLTSLAVLGLNAPSVSAGDKEWATAGKILTGLVAGAAIARTFEPVPVYQATTYYAPPAVQAPPPAIIQPMPVVVYSQPVYVQPGVIYVQPAPVYIVRPPLVSFGFSVGRPYHHRPPVYRVWR